MTAYTLDTKTLSTCIRQLEDVFVKLRHPQGSYVPFFVLEKLQQVLIYLEAGDKAEKEKNQGTSTTPRSNSGEQDSIGNPKLSTP